MKTLDCGCEVSEIDGFRYKTCDEHATRNPSFRYWTPEIQERARERERAALAKKAGAK